MIWVKNYQDKNCFVPQGIGNMISGLVGGLPITQGKGQFFPFIITIAGIVFSDLLAGIALGMVVAVPVILYNNHKVPYRMNKKYLKDQENIRIKLSGRCYLPEQSFHS
ncbi:MAG: hypothetical protein L3J31_02405 [Bacteroidales bacterium]|nr:hypothetical protein [Bacteroidales bacterium]MCF6341642.1 hypothetical protein [Bacteroidales bacterium]